MIDPDSDEIRRIRESDVMILVRSRNAFFEAMIRALKAADVKTAGADRLKLKDHIAVMDLIAAGRAALLPDDDLTLACALKSPLIGFDDDALMKLAAGRSGSLAPRSRPRVKVPRRKPLADSKGGACGRKRFRHSPFTRRSLARTAAGAR